MSRPGKFQHCADQDIGERLFGMTLDGWSRDSIGDVNEVGYHYSLLIDTDLSGAEFAIVEVNRDGFVDYETYETEQAAKEAYARCEVSVLVFYGEGE